MSKNDARKIARRIVDIERQLEGLRAKQLPFSAVTLDDGSAQGLVDGAVATRDALELTEVHDDSLIDIADISDASAVESTFLPERLGASDGSSDAAFDLGLIAVEQIRETRVELDGKLSDANERIEQTVADLGAAKERIDETFGVATGAKQIAEQAVAHVIDEFATSNDPAVAPETGWSLTPPPAAPGVFVWKRTTEELGDGSLRTKLPVMVTGPAGAAGAAGADAALLRISSSRGTSFKNNAIGTVLSVTVFLGALQIVNIEGLRAKFGPAAYLEWWWRREDDSGFGLISSSDDRLSQSGFALTISPADVDEQTIFQCIMHT